MMNKFKKLTLCILLITLSSCATRFKKAKELMAEKNYDEALVIMEQLVSQDPSDSDYQVGRKEARLGVIGQSLIKVRLTRLANNTNESLELLRKVFDQQNSWGLFPTGAVAFTQNEEIDEAYKNIRTEISSLDHQNKHLRILYMIERYKELFSEARRKSLDPQFLESKKQSQKICVEKSKQTSQETYFFNQFIDRLCHYVDKKATITKSTPELYNRISLNLEARSQVPPSFVNSLSNSINQKMQKSGWINPESEQTMSVQVDGDYFYREMRLREPRTHAYTEKIKSTAPNGSVTEREEPRTFYYSVNIVKQDFDTVLAFKNNDAQIGFYKDSYENSAERTYHDYSNYSIGLSPSSSGQSYSELEWQNMGVEAYSKKYLTFLENTFNQKFCQTLSESQPKIQLLNQSLKCIQQIKFNDKPKEIPSIITRAFESEFGVNTTEFETLIKMVN